MCGCAGNDENGMPLDPKAVTALTPRAVRASGVLEFVQHAEAAPGESQLRVHEVSSIQAEKAREMQAKASRAKAARRNRGRRRQEQ